jgi:zinc/manganese transport system substrate-binding protein
MSAPLIGGALATTHRFQFHLAAMLGLVLATTLLGLSSLAAADIKIAVLHPLLGDIAREVGGDRVEVVDLIGPNGDPHHFEAGPEELRQAEGASIYLLAGMGLEGYLPKLKAIIAGKVELIEVGATLPPLEGTHCDDHHHEVDPHWWHSIDLFRRAVGIVTQAMVTKSPANTELFQKNAEIYRKQLDDLERWARREISKIPRDRRHLATAHAAFNYFCKDYSFIPHPVQGLNREQMPDPAQLAALVADLKSNQVGAIFPEKESNPKILQTLTNDTGIQLGDPLIADGTGGAPYVAMYRQNVTAIVKGLAAKP